MPAPAHARTRHVRCSVRPHAPPCAPRPRDHLAHCAGTSHAELAGGGPGAGRGARPPAASRVDRLRRLWVPPPSSLVAGLRAPYAAGHVAPPAVAGLLSVPPRRRPHPPAPGP